MKNFYREAFKEANRFGFYERFSHKEFYESRFDIFALPPKHGNSRGR